MNTIQMFLALAVFLIGMSTVWLVGTVWQEVIDRRIGRKRSFSAFVFGICLGISSLVVGILILVLLV